MTGIGTLKALPRYLVGVALVICVDVRMGPEMSLWAALLVPIGLATWNHGKLPGIAVALVGILALLLEAALIGSPFGTAQHLLFELFSRASVFVIFVLLLDKMRQQEVSRVFIINRSNKNP